MGGVVEAKDNRPHVIILGGGFGGLTAAQAMRRLPVRVTLIDRSNHFLFQPLLYQVAMAGLSPADIAVPIRSVLRRHENATVILDQVSGVDLVKRTVQIETERLHYDFLVLATGARNHYFGHSEWAKYAVGLKDLDDAIEIRRRVLVAFEAAERTGDAVERQRLLTFVVVGGGATGVELAGALGELARFVLARDFRHINPASAQVLLLEGSRRILGNFSEKLSRRAVRDLYRLGVEVRTQKHVTRIDETGVYVGDQYIATATVLWGAGVKASPLARQLGVPLDRNDRVIVESDLTVPGHPEVFVIGDMAVFLHQGGQPLPGISPVAMQQGRHVAKNIAAALRQQPHTPLHFFDKGNMATIGRAAAVAQIRRLEIGGFFAWLLWLLVHIFFLITFRNRVAVLIGWAYQYFAYKRGARLITGHRIHPGFVPESTEPCEVSGVQASVQASVQPP